MSVDHVVVVLLDSLNRHHLGSYGGEEFHTPNLDRFARRATRFTRHHTGSLPCMPARHDILCGALDFLWKPWGSIELWEQSITAALRDAGVVTMLASDHPHLFETGGENYHTDFSAWEYVRGHEGDPWRTYDDPSWVGVPVRLNAGFHRPYDTSRTWFRDEEDFPGPRTMRVAAEWVRGAAAHHDRWLLFVDEFDPHEPFDTPEPWAGRYDPDWTDPRITWPPYDIGAVREGRLTEREGRQVRANYGAKLAMIDHWFGVLLDALDDAALWESTAVVVCTDHGHYLGEKDIWGKPGVMQYEPLGHMPLLVHWPGSAPERRTGSSTAGGTSDALTTSVDLFATIADAFDVSVAHRTHGRSLVPVLEGRADSVRDWVLGGVYGNWVQVTDGTRKYARAPAGDNFPLSMWSNRWSTMPIHGFPNLLAPPDARARLDFMPGSEVPVIRQPFTSGDRLPYWVGGLCVDQHHLFDVGVDPTEDEDLVGTRIEQEMIDLLRAALEDVEAPAEQYERLGIA